MQSEMGGKQLKIDPKAQNKYNKDLHLKDGKTVHRFYYYSLTAFLLIKRVCLSSSQRGLFF